jgi:hypothetical protein
MKSTTYAQEVSNLSGWVLEPLTMTDTQLGIADPQTHYVVADICFRRSVDLVAYQSAAQAVGRDSPVTGSPACYRLAVVSDLRVRRKSEIPIQTTRTKLLGPLKPFCMSELEQLNIQPYTGQ